MLTGFFVGVLHYEEFRVGVLSMRAIIELSRSAGGWAARDVLWVLLLFFGCIDGEGDGGRSVGGFAAELFCGEATGGIGI